MDDTTQTNQDDLPLITPTADPGLVPVIESVEKDLVLEIMTAIQKDEMTPEDAQKLAQEFLALLPIADKQELLNKLRNLGTENKQAKFVYNTYVAGLDEQKRQQTLDEMHQHIKNGNIDQALQIAKASYGHTS